jgi:tRNA pseudouridine38-40 synthase
VRHIKLSIAYEGTDFAGWQRQRGDRSVQETIEEAVAAVTGERVPVVGAGRTDRGVHALGQVACFSTESAVPIDRFPLAVNVHLPPAVRVVHAEEVPPSFHPRRSATAKHYRYTIWCDRIAPALWRNFTAVVHHELDRDRMVEAAAALVGEHDFRAFKNKAKGQERVDTRKTVFEIVLRSAAQWLITDILGGGFLYKQVRTMVGTLLEVGRGAMTPPAVRELVAAGDRRRAGPTAPAPGLCLMQVFYGPVPAGWYEVPGPVVGGAAWAWSRLVAPPPGVRGPPAENGERRS